VIVTSDHGESLGEPGLVDARLWEHDHMVQTNLRVPLVMRWPKHVPAGVRVKALTDEIDVVPTVCDLLGIQLPHEDGPFGAVDGRSLLPLVRGESAQVREYSFAENGTLAAVQDLRWKLVVPATAVDASDKGDGTSLKPWLIDLDADPGEIRNVAPEHAAEVDRLLAALRTWSASMPIRKADEVLSPRELERQRETLGKFGYAGKGQDGPHYPGQPPPKKP
jgi:arylsulfatase A-like enzyme